MQYRRREVIARLRTESNKRKITIDVDPKWTHTKTQLALFARNADSRYGDYWLGYRISSKLSFEKYIRDMLRPSVATPRLDNAHPQNIKLNLINSNIMNHEHFVHHKKSAGSFRPKRTCHDALGHSWSLRYKTPVHYRQQKSLFREVSTPRVQVKNMTLFLTSPV